MGRTPHGTTSRILGVNPMTQIGTLKAAGSVPRAKPIAKGQFEDEGLRGAPRRASLTNEVADMFGPTSQR
eukprot:8069257-Lingulodinium_polyedra.AAC.1